MLETRNLHSRGRQALLSLETPRENFPERSLQLLVPVVAGLWLHHGGLWSPHPCCSFSNVWMYLSPSPTHANMFAVPGISVNATCSPCLQEWRGFSAEQGRPEVTGVPKELGLEAGVVQVERKPPTLTFVVGGHA